MMDKKSFILGMITAFCECVAGGCKRLALSPPLTAEDYAMAGEEAQDIITRHGLVYYHELNEEIPPEQRFESLLIAGSVDTIEQYLQIRKTHNLVNGLEPFEELLSYDPERRISTGYDAYRTFFPLK